MSSQLPDSVEQIVDRFETAWEGPTPPRLEDYLKEVEPAHRLTGLVELIRFDLDCRIERGEPKKVEKYLADYPELENHPRAIAKLVTQEYQSRRVREPNLELDEILARLPKHRAGMLRELETQYANFAIDRPQESSRRKPRSAHLQDDTRVGQLVLGRYYIHHRLGGGAMGEVYVAEDRLLRNQEVALKFLPKERAGDQRWREQLTEEVRIALAVSHPRACRIRNLEFLREDNQPFITMEYIEGENLDVWLDKLMETRKCPPPPAQALKWAKQLCEGLWALHSLEILHRDLKPANVMLAKNAKNGEFNVKLTDFGLAALEGDVPSSQIGDGTLAYQAPEQLNRKQVTRQSDVYSLGLILYELFTGKKAFPPPRTDDGAPRSEAFVEFKRKREQKDFKRPSEHVAELDRRIERVILRCLEPRPEDRPASASEVASALGVNITDWEAPTTEAPIAALPCWLGGALLALVLFCLVGVVAFADQAMLHLQNPPSPDLTEEILRKKAKDIIRLAHYLFPDGTNTETMPDEKNIWLPNPREKDIWLPNLRYHEELKGKNKEDVIFTLYSYRQSPRDLAATDNRNLTAGIVTPTNPPIQPGMAGVTLDTKGRFLEFYYYPRQLIAAADPGKINDLWVFLENAELGLSVIKYDIKYDITESSIGKATVMLQPACQPPR